LTTSQSVHYVPLIPGIFIDFDESIKPNGCDNIFGEPGMSSEFYFNQSKLSKMFIDLSSYSKPKPIRRNDALDIKEKMEEEVRCGNIDAIQFPEKWNQKPS
jgi:hypothetical protein